MIITRHGLKYFRDLKAGTLFKKSPNERVTYAVVDPSEGAYKRISSKETLKYDGDIHRWEVYESYRVENEIAETSLRGYEALVAEAEKTGWPEHFHDDLFFHDRMIIYERNPSVFGWAVRNTGTELIIPNNTHSIFLLTYYQRPEYDLERPRHRFYFWDGRELKQSTLEKIEAGILKASCAKTREFAKQAWYTKNNTTTSRAWQNEINAELKGAATLRAEAILHNANQRIF